MSSVSILNNQATPIYAFPPIPKKQSVAHVFNVIAKHAEHVWSYLGKISLISRQILNATSTSIRLMCHQGKDIKGTLKSVITHMKLLSIVGVPFSILDVKNLAIKIFHDFLNRDKEGIILSTLSVTILLADIFDSLTTFVNSVLAAASVPISILASVGMPLAYVMSGLGIVLRTIQIARGAHFYKEVKHQLLSKDKFKDRNVLQNFLEKKLGIDKERHFHNNHPHDIKNLERLKARNKAALLRSAPAEAVKELRFLFSLLENDSTKNLDDQLLKQISNSLEKIQHHLRKKLRVDLLSLLANLITTTALILFTIGTGGAAPFILLATSITVRLSIVIYQDILKKKNTKKM
ncbi:MAG: hypothetical protein BGO14_09100 [Chlamydiales bacterium 38-26]|nr:hypothetical protein [Chlamydiales bacterium]OJV11134.1 MAG: hypothetical protein BGO14_09100 [Chlamydiales bacterium 38-26]